MYWNISYRSNNVVLQFATLSNCKIYLFMLMKAVLVRRSFTEHSQLHNTSHWNRFTITKCVCICINNFFDLCKMEIFARLRHLLSLPPDDVRSNVDRIQYSNWSAWNYVTTLSAYKPIGTSFSSIFSISIVGLWCYCHNSWLKLFYC